MLAISGLPYVVVSVAVESQGVRAPTIATGVGVATKVGIFSMSIEKSSFPQ
jgi:hypothetical protein